MLPGEDKCYGKPFSRNHSLGEQPPGKNEAGQQEISKGVQGEKSTELENLEITLEAVPVHCAFTDL